MEKIIGLEERIIELIKDDSCEMNVRNAGVYRFAKGYQFQQHKHMEYEINHISSGQAIMYIEGKKTVIPQGRCIVIPPYKKHSFETAKTGCKITQLEMSMETKNHKGFLLDQQEKQNFYILKDCEDIIPLIERIARLHRKEKNEYFSVLQKLSVVELMVTLQYHMEEIDRNYSHTIKDKMQRILTYIKEHYEEEISLEEVAKREGISSRYLRKYFSEVMGISCIRYITKLRMERAKKLLWETNKNIITIAGEIGYENPQYFSRVFKKEEGITPKEYRMRWRGDKEN